MYVIWSNPLFRDALRMLLNHPDLEWVGCENELSQALGEIRTFQPNTILVEHSEDFLFGDFVERLEYGSSKLQIISLNMETNEILLYHLEHHSVIHGEELLNLILHSQQSGGENESQ